MHVRVHVSVHLHMRVHSCDLLLLLDQVCNSTVHVVPLDLLEHRELLGAHTHLRVHMLGVHMLGRANAEHTRGTIHNIWDELQ